MQNHRFLFPLLLIIYIFSPTLFGWILAPTAIWYKPYLLWLLMIVSIYLVQRFTRYSRSKIGKKQKRLVKAVNEP